MILKMYYLVVIAFFLVILILLLQFLRKKIKEKLQIGRKGSVPKQLDLSFSKQGRADVERYDAITQKTILEKFYEPTKDLENAYLALKGRADGEDPMEQRAVMQGIMKILEERKILEVKGALKKEG